MWQAAPLMIGELATYSPSSVKCVRMAVLWIYGDNEGLRIMTVHTWIKTKSPRYANFCNGKINGNTWYGTLCKNPSKGWKAWLAYGVGMIHLWCGLWSALYTIG